MLIILMIIYISFVMSSPLVWVECVLCNFLICFSFRVWLIMPSEQQQKIKTRNKKNIKEKYELNLTHNINVKVEKKRTGKSTATINHHSVSWLIFCVYQMLRFFCFLLFLFLFIFFLCFCTVCYFFIYYLYHFCFVFVFRFNIHTFWYNERGTNTIYCLLFW